MQLEEFMRRAALVGALAALCCSYADPCAAIAARGDNMPFNSETRKAAFRHAVQIWQNGRVDLISEVVTQDYVGHTSSGDRKIEALRQRVSDFHKLYPDITFRIEDQLVGGDKVATRMTATATSKVTGKPVHLIGLNISRFVGNRIAEEWPVWETVQGK